jgi:hypothetical protein
MRFHCLSENFLLLMTSFSIYCELFLPLYSIYMNKKSEYSSFYVYFVLIYKNIAYLLTKSIVICIYR